MNTLAMANILIDSGFERKQAESIVKIVDAENQENATKNDIKRLEWMIGFVVISGAGAFSYIFSMLNTVISKLG